MCVTKVSLSALKLKLLTIQNQNKLKLEHYMQCKSSVPSMLSNSNTKLHENVYYYLHGVAMIPNSQSFHQYF